MHANSRWVSIWQVARERATAADWVARATVTWTSGWRWLVDVGNSPWLWLQVMWCAIFSSVHKYVSHISFQINALQHDYRLIVWSQRSFLTVPSPTLYGLPSSGSHENFYGTIYRAHCAVIFAIAQLSCFTCDRSFTLKERRRTSETFSHHARTPV